MLTIRGFNDARPLLSRKMATVLGAVPETLKKRLRGMFGTGDATEVVARIINDVKNRGDDAIREYTERIDGVKLKSLIVSPDEVARAYREVAAEVTAALRLAAERINEFHTAEREAILGGVSQMGQKIVVKPLESVGIYVPGGTAAYPSTVLMTTLPARAAGVEGIVLISPPRADGKVSPLVLVAADIAGVNRIFSIGGAQGIAALAYGTESVPKVDKICGPGNIFVTLAKKLVFGITDIDGLQGPSEVLIIADGKASASYCAADLLAQAEHDPLASAILITTSEKLAQDVSRELERGLSDLPRQAIARESLDTQGRIIVVGSIDEAIELANLYAPEHLCLMVENAPKYTDRITSAGCVFLGENSAGVLGDYVAGPSHVLPTGGTARFSSPLNILDFVKFMNVVSLEESVFGRLWRAAAIIARAEGLEGHARAADKRLTNREASEGYS